MNKAVLVSFKERNKVLQINGSNEGEIVRLKKLFCHAFGETISEGQLVTFQRYDNAWDCFVDLEEGDTVENKDKLRVVTTQTERPVSSSIADAVNRPSEVSLSSSSPYSHPDFLENAAVDMEYEVTADGESSKVVDLELSISTETEVDNSSRSGNEVTTAHAAIGPSKYIFKQPPKHVLISSEDQDSPFPDPYILPTHFSQDVIDCLHTGKMTKDTQNSFLSGVASHIFYLKRKPSTEDIINVSRAVIAKYPFMRSPTGSPYGEIKKKLQNRLKEKRRIKLPRLPKGASTNSISLRPETQKKPSLNSLVVPPIPNGEDSTSFDRHNRVLQLQFSKSHRNNAVIRELMEISFSMRRREIIKNGHLFDIKKKFPFLQEPEHIFEEMKRIMKSNAAVVQAKEAWQEMTPRIIEQSKREGGVRIREKLLSLAVDDEHDGSNPLLALVLLAYLLPESKTKPDSDQIIQFCHGADVQVVINNSQPQPVIVVVGNYRQPEQAFLSAEKKILGEVGINDAAVALLSMYYVYNLCYPKGTGNVYSFLEASLFQLNLSDMSPSVSGLLARLNSV